MFDTVRKFFSPDQADRHFRQGFKFLQAQDLTSAAAEWRKALEIDPSLLKARVNLGNLQLMQRNFAEAIAEYQTAVDAGLESAELYSNLGAALRLAGNLEESLAAHHKALELSPDDTISMNNLAVCLLELNRDEEAKQMLARVLEQSEDDGRANCQLGFMYLKLNNFKQSLEHFWIAASDPNFSVQAKVGLARVHCRQGLLSDACDSLRQALEEDRNILQSIENDPDFGGLKDSPEYRSMLDELGKATFAFMLVAEAGAANSAYRAGEKHALVALAIETNLESAQQRAANELQTLGWDAHEFQTAGPVDAEALNSMEPQIQAAYERAQETGIHVFVFEDPIDGERDAP